MDKISVGIPTAGRTKKIENCLKSLENIDIIDEILVIDNGKINKEKKELYDKLETNLPLKIKDFPETTTLTESRNNIIDNCKNEYILMIDDDIYISDQFVLEKFISILEKDRKLGVLSASLIENNEIKLSSRNYYIKKNCLIKDTKKPKKVKEKENIKYWLFDEVGQCGIYKKKCLKDVRFDEKIMDIDDFDWFLTHKMRDTKWTFGVTPQFAFIHDNAKKQSYLKSREKKRNRDKKYILEKWNLDKIIGIKDYYIDSSKNFSDLLKEKIKGLLPFFILRRNII